MVFFDNGQTWCASQLYDAAPTVVTLRRGPQTTAGVTAVWQRPQAETLDSEGFATDLEVREWVIAKAAYVFAVTAATPQTGDRIEPSGEAWQVLPSDGKPAWREDGDDWVIQTKRVA